MFLSITNSEIKGGFFLLAFSLILALAVNRFSPSGIVLIGQWDPEKGVVMADSKRISITPAKEINNPLKLRRMIIEGRLVLIDARLRVDYNQGHLPGALSFPLHQFDENYESLSRVLKTDLPIVVYCSGVQCQDSHKFAGRLTAMGVKGVMVYSGGFEEWDQMGFDHEN